MSFLNMVEQQIDHMREADVLRVSINTWVNYGERIDGYTSHDPVKNLQRWLEDKGVALLEPAAGEIKLIKPHATEPRFNVGDRVVATDAIWRQDRRSIMHFGNKATVSSIWQSKTTQIINLNVDGQLPIHDLVCTRNLPLRKL